MKQNNSTTTREVAKDFKKLLEKELQAKKMSAQLLKIEEDIDLLKRVIQQKLVEENFIKSNFNNDKS